VFAGAGIPGRISTCFFIHCIVERALSPEGMQLTVFSDRILIKRTHLAIVAILQALRGATVARAWYLQGILGQMAATTRSQLSRQSAGHRRAVGGVQWYEVLDSSYTAPFRLGPRPLPQVRTERMSNLLK